MSAAIPRQHELDLSGAKPPRTMGEWRALALELARRLMLERMETERLRAELKARGA